jgi:hypothetical protein
MMATVVYFDLNTNLWTINGTKRKYGGQDDTWRVNRKLTSLGSTTGLSTKTMAAPRANTRSRTRS